MPAGLSLTLDAVVVRASGRTLLDTVGLRIARGERVALIGPSGAGKTTLLSVLGAALRPDEGRITIDDLDPWSLDARALRALRSRLFIAPQAPPLPPRQRVVTAVLAGRLPHWSLTRAVRSLWRPVEPERAAQALEYFDLADRLWARVDRLSGGERQRVALARMIVAEPALMLVDEPLAALDPALARQTLRRLVDTAQASGATMVCSLHQVDDALSAFDRIIGVRAGRIVHDGAARDVDGAVLDALYPDRSGTGLADRSVL